MDAVVRWCHPRRDRIDACFAVSGPDEVWLYVVAKSAPFDFGLNRELAEFAVELNRADGPVAATLLPPGSPTGSDSYTPGGGVFYHLKFPDR